MSEEKKNEEIKEETSSEEVKEDTAENIEETVEEEKVPSTEDVIASLQEEIKKKEEEIAKLKNAYAMAYADTENTRKRLTSDYESRMKYHMQDFAREVLPVLDNCERALAQSTQDEAYRKGVEMIYNQLKAALEKEGVKEIEAEGQPFDGNYHQALMSEKKDDVESGIVIQVLQKGYTLKDRLLRAAMVKVSE